MTLDDVSFWDWVLSRQQKGSVRIEQQSGETRRSSI